MLSPFNVLPLGPGLDPSIRLAVIIWNIAPFAPVIWKALPLSQRPRMRLLRKLTQLSIERADLVFLPSLEAQRRLGPKLDNSRTRFLPSVPPPPATIHISSQTPIPEHLRDVPFFVTVGDMFPYKGIEDAILATRLLVREGYRIRLVVCGAPMHPRYHARLRSLAEPVGSAVQFLDRTTQALSLAIMRASVATISCSRIENPGRVPAEAMSLGSPVLMADVPVSRETYGNAAVYYPPGAHEALAAFMAAMLEGRGREELIRQGQAWLSVRDWTSASRTILEAMGALPTRPGSPSTT